MPILSISDFGLCTMKGLFKQWLSTISPISTKRTTTSQQLKLFKEVTNLTIGYPMTNKGNNKITEFRAILQRDVLECAIPRKQKEKIKLRLFTSNNSYLHNHSLRLLLYCACLCCRLFLRFYIVFFSGSGYVQVFKKKYLFISLLFKYCYQYCYSDPIEDQLHPTIWTIHTFFCCIVRR
jgi:hypothetical protein